jgi:hypothetical protein
MKELKEKSSQGTEFAWYLKLEAIFFIGVIGTLIVLIVKKINY